MKVQVVAFVLALMLAVCSAEDSTASPAALPTAVPATSEVAAAPKQGSDPPTQPSLFPFMTRNERINQGLATVLQGVRGGNLEEILRGSFIFPGSPSTRTTANGVLDAIFNHNQQHNAGQ